MLQACKRSLRRRNGSHSANFSAQWRWPASLPLAGPWNFVQPTIMHILLIGSGGREHALAWKIAGSPLVTKLSCAPGNAGIAREAECVALDVASHQAVIEFCRSNAVELVVVGPETPLVAGIVDDLAAAGIKAFGPSRRAAELEGSKGFTKDFCAEFALAA